MLKTNVDNILELVKEHKSLSVSDLASQLQVPAETVMKTGQLLEEDGLIRIEHKLMKPYLTIVEKPSKQSVSDASLEPIQATKNVLETNIKGQQDVTSSGKIYQNLDLGEMKDASFARVQERKNRGSKAYTELSYPVGVPQKKSVSQDEINDARPVIRQLTRDIISIHQEQDIPRAVTRYKQVYHDFSLLPEQEKRLLRERMQRLYEHIKRRLLRGIYLEQ